MESKLVRNIKVHASSSQWQDYNRVGRELTRSMETPINSRYMVGIAN